MFIIAHHYYISYSFPLLWSSLRASSWLDLWRKYGNLYYYPLLLYSNLFEILSYRTLLTGYFSLRQLLGKVLNLFLFFILKSEFNVSILWLWVNKSSLVSGFALLQRAVCEPWNSETAVSSIFIWSCVWCSSLPSSPKE